MMFYCWFSYVHPSLNASRLSNAPQSSLFSIDLNMNELHVFIHENMKLFDSMKKVSLFKIYPRYFCAKMCAFD